MEDGNQLGETIQQRKRRIDFPLWQDFVMLRQRDYIVSSHSIVDRPTESILFFLFLFIISPLQKRCENPFFLLSSALN